MITKKIKYVITADAKNAESGFKKVNSSISKGTQGIKSMVLAAGKIGMVAGTALYLSQKIYGIGKLLTGTALEHEKAVLQLKTVLKSTGYAAGITYSDIKKLAHETRTLTGINDNLVISGAALLSTFTSIGRDIFPDAIKAAADMSALFGGSLESSIVRIGVALNAPATGYTRLKEIGVSFTEEQAKLIKMFVKQNDIMSAQKIILQELQTEMGGVAQSMPGLKFKNVGLALEDMFRSIGSVIMPWMENLSDSITHTAQLITTSIRAANTEADILQTNIKDQSDWWDKTTADQIDILKQQRDLYEEHKKSLEDIHGIFKSLSYIVSRGHFGADAFKWLVNTAIPSSERAVNKLTSPYDKLMDKIVNTMADWSVSNLLKVFGSSTKKSTIPIALDISVPGIAAKVSESASDLISNLIFPESEKTKMIKKDVAEIAKYDKEISVLEERLNNEREKKLRKDRDEREELQRLMKSIEPLNNEYLKINKNTEEYNRNVEGFIDLYRKIDEAPIVKPSGLYQFTKDFAEDAAQAGELSADIFRDLSVGAEELLGIQNELIDKENKYQSMISRASYIKSRLLKSGRAKEDDAIIKTLNNIVNQSKKGGESIAKLQKQINNLTGKDVFVKVKTTYGYENINIRDIRELSRIADIARRGCKGEIEALSSGKILSAITTGMLDITEAPPSFIKKVLKGVYPMIRLSEEDYKTLVRGAGIKLREFPKKIREKVLGEWYEDVLGQVELGQVQQDYRSLGEVIGEEEKKFILEKGMVDVPKLHASLLKRYIPFFSVEDTLAIRDKLSKEEIPQSMIDSLNSAQRVILDNWILHYDTVVSIAQESIDAMSGSMDRFVSDVISGQNMMKKNWGEYLKYMVDSFVLAVSRMIAKYLAFRAITGFLNIISPGLGKAVGATLSGVKGQHGVDFIVPAGFPNDTFPVFAQSGERVIIIPRERAHDTDISPIRTELQLLRREVSELEFSPVITNKFTASFSQDDMAFIYDKGKKVYSITS